MTELLPLLPGLCPKCFLNECLQPMVPEPLGPNFTFHPRVNDYTRVTNKPRPPLKETLQNLSRPQSHLFAERERQKLERDQKAMEECTFRPQLCPGTEMLRMEKAAKVGKY